MEVVEENMRSSYTAIDITTDAAAKENFINSTVPNSDVESDAKRLKALSQG